MNPSTEQLRASRSGFNRPALIVLIGLAILGSVLWMQWLTGSRVPSRSSECSNNMRNAGLSLVKYDTIQGRLPGYVVVEVVDGVPRRRPWVWSILPTLERRDLYSVSEGYAGDGLRPLDETPYLSVLTCPSNPIYDKPINSYVLNTGLQDGLADANTPADWQANAAFHSAFPLDEAGKLVAVTHQSINWISDHDGSSNTLLVSESLAVRMWPAITEPEVGMVWRPTLDPPWIARIEAEPIAGHDPYDLARPSSNHTGIVNAYFADNHAQRLNKKIDYRVYCQLLAPHDAGVRPPGVNSNLTIPDAIRNTPLPDEY